MDSESEKDPAIAQCTYSIQGVLGATQVESRANGCSQMRPIHLVSTQIRAWQTRLGRVLNLGRTSLDSRSRALLWLHQCAIQEPRSFNSFLSNFQKTDFTHIDTMTAASKVKF